MATMVFNDKTNNMNLLSLFNGMSCSKMAFDELNIPISKFYVSEIDKYANKLTSYLYPEAIHLGSVVDVDVTKLDKIDFIAAGSPCQSFSFAGKRKGMATKCEEEILSLEKYLNLKSQGFEFEGQSYLFWEFIRIYNDCKKINPEVKFLLENVEMGEKWEKVLSKAVGYNGIHINSALVSAQNRKRIYWINFGLEPRGLFNDLESIVRQPKDKGILLKDILESEVDEKYFLSDKMIAGFKRLKDRHNDKGTGFGYVPKNEDDKGNSLRANAALCPTDNMLIVHNTMPRSSTTGKGGTGPLSRNDGKTYCLDTGNTNAVEIILTSKDKRLQKIVDDNTFIQGEVAHLDTYNQTIDKDKSPALKLPLNDRFIIAPTKSLNENQQKKFNPNINSDKANALTLAQGRAGSSDEYMDAVSKIANITSRIRRLTPKECLRLQTIPEHLIEKILTSGTSDTQIYKMAGNGWTVKVIAHLLQYLNLTN
jgi:DNA-cytosine methyltransferase